jgi:hypothetical protein
MNLVKLITDQFSDETLGKLSAVLGTDSETASAAATAAVPTLLSGLAGMASRGEGAKKLTDMLSGIDAGSMGNLASLLGGDTGSLLQRGTGLLSSLFNDNIISGASNAISRYAGINPGTAKTLLAALLPMVLGKVAAQWRSQGGTVSALTSLFADQKRNIADAVPAGFSLADIPGLPGAEAARAATDTTRRTAEKAEAATSSAASWILPLAVLLVGGFLLWKFLVPRPAGEIAADKTERTTTTAMKPVVPETRPATPDMAAMPDLAQMPENMKSFLTNFGDQLGTIKDAASAEAAAPKLEEMKAKLDGFRTAWARLPEASQPALRQMISAQMTPLREKSQQTLAVPGISDRIKALINDILQRLTELATQPSPAAPAQTR